MVKHIILWTLNPELSEEEKTTVKAGIKAGLEGLKGKVPGLIDVKVNVDGRLETSNCDVMLDSTLESFEAHTIQRTPLSFSIRQLITSLVSRERIAGLLYPVWYFIDILL